MEKRNGEQEKDGFLNLSEFIEPDNPFAFFKYGKDCFLEEDFLKDVEMEASPKKESEEQGGKSWKSMKT